MADEQDRWLDRGTAERLLSGEPPEAADPDARDQAERLAATLRALSAPPPAAGEGLPGEAAALAAFRAAREERAAGAASTGPQAGTQPSDLGPIHIRAPRGDGSGTAAGPRRTRPVRLGLAAALVAGLVGGAAVLAGTGVLPTPSDGSGPAASATHAERPLLSSPPNDGTSGGAAPGGRQPDGADGTARDGVGARGDEDKDEDGDADGPEPGETGAGSGRGGQQIVSACRAWHDGEELDGHHKRLVEKAAGGPSRVGAYCAGVLSEAGTAGAGGTGGTGGVDPDVPDVPDAPADTGAAAGTGAGGNGNGPGNGTNGGQGNGDTREGGGDKGAGGNQGTGGTQGNQGNSRSQDNPQSTRSQGSQGSQGNEGNEANRNQGTQQAQQNQAPQQTQQPQENRP